MKRIFILSFLFTMIVSPFPSYADWKPVSKSVETGNTFYVDLERIRQSKGYVYFWYLEDYLTKDKYGDLSSTMFMQVDCNLFSLKVLKFHFYKKSMGEGDADIQDPVKEVQSWIYATPKSNYEYMLKVVCNTINN